MQQPTRHSSSALRVALAGTAFCALIALAAWLAGDPAFSAAKVGIGAAALAMLAVAAFLRRRLAARDDGRKARSPAGLVDLANGLALGALAVGLALSGAVGYELSRHSANVARMRFDQLSDRMAREAARRLDLCAYALDATRGLYAASDQVKRHEFREFVNALGIQKRFEGSLGVGLIQRVARERVDEFSEAERCGGEPAIRVRSRGDAEQLYVLRFMEPAERHRAALGVDFGDDAGCRAAIERAVDTGEPTLARAPRFLAAARQGPTYLYLAPIFRKATAPVNAEERRDALAGVACMPLALDAVFAGLTQAAGGQLNFDVFEGHEAAREKLILDVDGLATSADGASDHRGRRIHEHHRLTLGGFTWTLATSTTPSFEQAIERASAWVISAAGAILVVAVSVLIWSLSATRSRALALARHMTTDLQAEKVRAEAALGEANALRAALDQSSGIAITDLNGFMLEVNEQFCRVSGYGRAELLGRNHRIFNSGAHPPAFWAEMWRTVAAGRPWRREVCNRAKDGSLFWVDALIAPFKEEQGRVAKYVSISTEITARKQAEAERAAALAAITELARAADVKQAARAVNDVLEQVTGLSRTAILLYESDGVCRFVGWRGLSEAYRRKVEGHCPWAAGARAAEAIVVEDALNDPDWKQYRALFERENVAALAFVPILTHGGVIGKLMLYSTAPRGISAVSLAGARAVAEQLGVAIGRLRMAEALARSEARLRAVIDTALDAAVSLNADGEVTAWNRQAEATFGWSAAEAIGRPVDELVIPAELREAHRAGLARYLSNGESRALGKRFEASALRKDGARITIELAITPVRGVDGISFSAFLRDVSAAKRAAAELVSARASADAASRAKSEFLANMSHEIRTPLTAILGYADLLCDDPEIANSAERRRQTLDTIRTAGQHLLTIINDILDLSKIEAGKMTIECVETSIPLVLHEVESVIRTRTVGKGVELELRLDSPIPDRILSDPTRLRQILMNIAGNAAKFTEAGRISIIVRTEKSGAAPRLLIDVEDTGPGLTHEQADALFAPFVQADATVTRRHGGTGLGLTICRRLAELMGGTVLLASTRPGRGSCFRIELPLVAADRAVNIDRLDVVRSEPAAPSSAASIRLSGRILLAEDGPDNQRLIAHVLRKAGADVVVAENGRVALDLIEQAAGESRPFDMLLTDIQMPEMDGYSLAASLRASGSQMPIVALTAHAMAEDRRRCETAGCDDYATKPINKAVLLETCAKWLRSADGIAVSQAAAESS